jgi:hypothetical protein
VETNISGSALKKEAIYCYKTLVPTTSPYGIAIQKTGMDDWIRCCMDRHKYMIMDERTEEYIHGRHYGI